MLFASLRSRLRSASLGPRLRRHLRPGDTLLDVGAGTGFFATWLRDHAGVRATLTDIVDYGEDRDRSLPFIHQTDPKRVPAENGSFDVVLLMFVLHHIADRGTQEHLVGEAMRVARKRVLIVEDTPECAWDWSVNTCMDWALNVRHGIPTPFTFRSSKTWERTFSARGWRVSGVERFRSVWPSFGLYNQSLFVLDATPSPAGLRAEARDS